MRKSVLILFLILTNLSVHAQDITGKWHGLLSVQGVQLRLVFNITKTERGFRSTMDSPDQGAKGIPVTSMSYKDSVLKLEISGAGIQYDGTLDKDNRFVGTFRQGGQSFSLDLIKAKIEEEPQEPTKPYPYYSEEVKFKNPKDKIELAGTLTLPEKDGNFPAVILISGSGPQNRDEEILGHKPFLVLADYLTKKGIAVLRFDDRGTGESSGNFRAATLFDFARDVEFAVRYLQTRKEINKNKIGLIGHSEGGIIAPMIAEKSKDINFIVLLAAVGIRGDQLLLLQQELIGKVSGIGDKELQKANAINKGAFHIILESDNDDSLRMELTNYLKKVLKDNPELKKTKGMSENDYINLQVAQLVSPGMKSFIRCNPAPTLEKISCPVLAINGAKDLQVPAKVNLTAIKNALEKGGNKNVTIKELPNLNHLFQECKTGSPSEYATIEQTFSPIALEEISNWILMQVK